MAPAPSQTSLRQKSLASPIFALEDRLQALALRLAEPPQEFYGALAATADVQDQSAAAAYQMTLQRLQSAVEAAEAVSPLSSLSIPLSLATVAEWTTLASAAVSHSSRLQSLILNSCLYIADYCR